MGGYGSGRRGSKNTTESQYRIDIRWLRKQGFLQPGAMSSLSWSCGDKETGFIHYHMETNRMILYYRYRFNGGEWEPVEQTISFDQTPCNYGGHKTWFFCPRCWKRVAILYGAGKYFLCRHCYDLAYSSQQEGRPDRLMRKARKIRRLIGGSDDLSKTIWLKPKHMHQKTFDRLRRKADPANNLSWMIMAQQMGIHF